MSLLKAIPIISGLVDLLRKAKPKNALTLASGAIAGIAAVETQFVPVSESEIIFKYIIEIILLIPATLGSIAAFIKEVKTKPSDQ